MRRDTNGRRETRGNNGRCVDATPASHRRRGAMEIFGDARRAKYESLCPRIGCASKSAAARDSYAYNVLPIDACYWERKFDETLSVCSSARSTTPLTLADELAATDPEPDPEPDPDPSASSRNAESSAEWDTATVVTEPFADDSTRLNGAIPGTSTAWRFPDYSEADPESRLHSAESMSTMNVRDLNVCYNRINDNNSVDVKNISIKRLYLLNTILSTMLIICCLAGILYLVIYMFQRNET